jgi:hypothetical protein
MERGSVGADCRGGGVESVSQNVIHPVQSSNGVHGRRGDGVPHASCASKSRRRNDQDDSHEKRGERKIKMSWRSKVEM